MCDPVSAVIGGAAILGAGTSIYTSSKRLKAQRKAQAAAEAQAREEAARQTRQFNKVNQKQPDIAQLLKRNVTATAGGVGSTSLTGPRGASAPQLGGGVGSLLGSNTVLGL